MKVKQLMSKKVIKVKAGSSLEQAATVLIKNKISGAPVVDAAGKMVGVISEKDLFTALYPNFTDILGDVSAWFDNEKREYKLKAKKEIIIDSIMTKKVITISPDAAVLEAGGKLITNSIHRLVVIGPGKKIMGVITRSDIFYNILKKDLDIK